MKTAATLACSVLALSAFTGVGAVAFAQEKEAVAASVKAAEAFPSDWFYPKRPQDIVALEGKALPKVDLAKAAWVGGKAPAEADLAGKILVIDMWATWCGPCRDALPHNAALAKENVKEGVVVLGLCASGDEPTMKKLQEKAGVEYPAAFAGAIQDDIDKAWHTPWFPYYLVVDRKGVVRGAGLHHGGVAEAVKALLKEQPAEEKKDDKK